MKIVGSEICLFCKECPETIEHIYSFCRNSTKLWNETISWVRNISDHHFITSDHEKIFGCSTNNQITHLIIISVKDVIYQKRKNGKPTLRISRKKGSFFKTSACPRFCKRRVLFCTQVRSMGVKIPLQSTNYTQL